MTASGKACARSSSRRNRYFALGDKYAARVKTAEMLAVGWLEHKLPEELEAYRHVTQVAHLERHDQFHLIESGPKM